MSINANDFFTWPTTFSCVLVLDDMLLPNEYSLSIGMMPSLTQEESRAVGLKKIKHFITKFAHHSTVIPTTHHLLPQISLLQTNAIHLPQAPYDHFFAAALFRKLTAISKNYFTIQQITIDSTIGDRVQYQISSSCDVYDEILNKNSWWNQDNVNTNDLHKFPSWEELDITVSNRFSPKIIKGGKSEIRSI
jgi:hypothetical protein